MTALVIAEHDNASLKASTLNTVTAAAQCAGEVHILVAGHHCDAAAAAAAQVAGVAKVIVAHREQFADGPRPMNAHRGVSIRAASRRPTS